MKLTSIFIRVLSIVAAAIVIVSMAACSAFSGQNGAATSVAQITPAELESTALIAAMDAQGTEVALTAIAAETYILQMEGINQQLLLTMRAVIPPTQQVVQSAGPATPGMNEIAGAPPANATPATAPNAEDASGGVQPGGTQFVQVTTARSVSDADGCALDNTTAFTSNDSRIYITARAYNITAGTVMGATWSYNGAVVYNLDSFTVEQDDDDFCLWFYIDPESVPFTPGQWSVQLTANDLAVGQLVNFSIEDAM